MAKPKEVPTKQKRFLQDKSIFINLNKEESKLMGDLCRFFTFGDDIICIDQANKAIHLLFKNGDGLYIKKQTLQLEKPEEPIEKIAKRIVNRLKSKRMTQIEQEQFFLIER